MKKYASKLLLFGEYTIIKGGSALAFPLSNYCGNWDFSDDVDNANLLEWKKYIEGEQSHNSSVFGIDTERFEVDLKKGLFFNSDIPMGYGVGSSGALCAALYDEYAVKISKLSPASENVFQLKMIFQMLENFFHGSSSGVDPLICYLNQPLLLKGKREAELIKLKSPINNQSAIFLLDTRRSRQTEPLVNFFLEKLKNENFSTSFEMEWCVYNEAIIEAFLNQNHIDFFENIHLLSQFQYNHLSRMIPDDFVEIWKNGLESQLYTIKLCGAGGGGFLLGFTEDWEATKKVLRVSGFELIRVRTL
ncbi:MAG: mevalonate kinase [Cognaticolwellia sp.]|jgi:mevalonate kinase